MFKHVRNSRRRTAPGRESKQDNLQAKLGGHASTVSEAKKTVKSNQIMSKVQSLIPSLPWANQN